MKTIYRIVLYTVLFTAAMALLVTADTVPMNFTANLALIVLGTGIAAIDIEIIYALEIYLDDSTEGPEEPEEQPATAATAATATPI